MPSAMSPQLMSISSCILENMVVFVASLTHGTGLLPKQDPLPVVKQIRLHPDETCPVTEQGSKPGESMKLRPVFFMGCP